MLNIMDKSKALSAPKADARSSYQNWAAQENQFISKLIEQPVTNRQTLLIIHCLMSFFSFILMSSHLVTAIVTFVWFCLSLYSAKKGGLK